MQIGRALCLASLLAGLFATIGCGGDDAPRALVQGKVLLDGSPMQEGEVAFIPASGSIGSSQITADGSYSLIGQDKNPGVTPGAYTVIIMPSAAQIKKAQGDPMVTVKASSIPPIYSNAATSKLKHEVKEGANEIDLLLEATPAK